MVFSLCWKLQNMGPDVSGGGQQRRRAAAEAAAAGQMHLPIRSNGRLAKAMPSLPQLDSGTHSGGGPSFSADPSWKRPCRSA